MRLGYIILYVADVQSTVTFYEKAFGLKRRFIHESNTYAEMETGQTALEPVLKPCVIKFLDCFGRFSIHDDGGNISCAYSPHHHELKTDTKEPEI